MKVSLQHLSTEYNNLIPRRLDTLVVFHIKQQIKSNKIDDEFTEQQLKNVIEKVIEEFNFPEATQIEPILQRLSYFFIEYSPDDYSKRTLTDYAERYIELLDHKLSFKNPYSDFSLENDLQRFLLFDAKEMDSFLDFENWYNHGFNNTSKKTIVGHLENLQDRINKSIKDLNEILNSDEFQAMEKIDRFVKQFNNIGNEAKQIRSVLEYKTSAFIEIEAVVKNLYENIINYQNNEATRMAQARKEYHYALKYQRNINKFFEKIDKKIDNILNQIRFASSQLDHLKDDFKEKAKFKLNLKNALIFILNKSKYDKESLKLPFNFPIAKIPYEKVNFLSASPTVNFNHRRKNKVVNHKSNIEHHKSEVKKIENELIRQEKVYKWVENIKSIISNRNEINLSDYLYEIINEDKETEIAVKVGFDLLEYAEKNPELEIEIDKEFYPKNLNDIQIWNMKIINKRKISTF